jgi:hypothetical protein
VKLSAPFLLPSLSSMDHCRNPRHSPLCARTKLVDRAAVHSRVVCLAHSLGLVTRPILSGWVPKEASSLGLVARPVLSGWSPGQFSRVGRPASSLGLVARPVLSGWSPGQFSRGGRPASSLGVVARPVLGMVARQFSGWSPCTDRAVAASSPVYLEPSGTKNYKRHLLECR